MNKNKVLLLTDGSEFSKKIVPSLRRFLDPAVNELIVLQVADKQHAVYLQTNERGHGQTVYVDQVESSLRAELVQSMRPLFKTLQEAKFSVTPTVRFGEPAEKIKQVIAEERIDLVAMTTHGRTGLSRTFLGSVTEELLHQVSIPFLVVRPFDSENEYMDRK